MQRPKVFIGMGMFAGFIVVVALLFNLRPQGVNASSRMKSLSALPDTPLTAQSDPQDVLMLMLHSHSTWDTVSLSAVEMTRNLEDGNIAESVTHMQIKQPDKAFLTRTLGGQKYVWRTDGNTIFTELDDLNVYTTQVVPNEVKESFQNYVVPLIDSSEPAIYPHPFGVGIPTGLNDQIYPTGIAQNMFQNAEVAILGKETIVNRAAIVISRTHVFEDGTIAKKHTYWVDAETGVILKYQVCVPENENLLYQYGCNWIIQTVITQILFDKPMTDSMFDLTKITTNSRYVPWDELERLLWGQSPSDLPFVQQGKES